MNGYTYSEEYDTYGRITKTEGIPLVLRNIKDVSPDSAYIDLFLFSLNRVYTNVIVSIQQVTKFKVEPLPDSLYSNMMKASFGINTKGSNEMKIVIITEYHIFCESSKRSFTDTIHLSTKPTLNILPNRRI